MSVVNGGEMTAIPKEEYDAIISLGNNCASTIILREAGLQEKTFPFDWLASDSFESRILMLINGFKDFFNREDFFIREDYIATDKKFDAYKNHRTEFYFYHDFSKEQSFDDVFDEVKVKYERRIKRLYEKIAVSKKILFVWFDKKNVLTNQQINNAYALLSKKFPNQNISFLILENDENVDLIRRDELTPLAVKYTYKMIRNKDSKERFYSLMGDRQSRDYVFSQYAITPIG